MDNKQIERFNAQLENMLRGHQPDMNGEDADLLELAQRLAQTDFSTESRIRDDLKARLMQTRTPQKAKIVPFAPARRALVAAAAVLLVVMVATVPPLRAAAQEVINQVWGMLFIREETRAEILDGQVAPTSEGDMFIPFEVESLESVSRQAGFTPLVPAVVPDDYTLTSRFVPQTGTNTEVVSDYTHSNGDILHISQVQYDPTWPPPQWAVGDAVPQPVTVRGVEGTYVDQAPIGVRRLENRFETYGVNILTWEQDGMRFILQSAELNLDALLQIAESMQ